MSETRYWRNVANEGRGSAMTRALHDACNEIDRLQAILAVAHPDKAVATSEICPVCKSDLTGDEIPEKYLHLYGGITHYSRKIGIYNLDADRTVKWSCPDCGGTWPA